MKQTFAVAALISATAAVKTPDGSPVWPQEFHFNEDPHSVPTPIAGKPYMTATQAKYIRKETWDTDTEVTDIHPYFHVQHNRKATIPKASESWMTKYWGKEPLAVQLRSDESDSDSDDDEPENQQAVQWQVTPDLGEMDDHATLRRESDNDYLIGKAKFHGWTNPLGWTDNGNDDDLVLMQMTADGLKERRIPNNMFLQYEEAEGPTKVDLGDIDHVVVGREADNDYLIGKSKFHGWTNPLGWTDDGADDEKIL